MDATFAAVATLVALSVAGHLWAEARGWPAARAALKGAASAGFLLAAVLRASPAPFARWVLVGLVLSMAGDLCLLGQARRTLLAGIVAFLAAHLAFAAAFAPRARPSLPAAVGVAAAAALVVRWLWPSLGALRGPVLAYTAAISVMVLLGVGTASLPVRFGAVLFFASDVTVARDRFAAPGFVNRVVGLPIYYAGQLCFAFALGEG